MPIGKNAIKRITNNGYSAVKASAPDMENSEVIEKKTVATEKKPSAKKPEAKKTPAKSAPKTKAAKKVTPAPKKAPIKKPSQAPKKSMESEPSLSPVKALEKVAPKPKRTGAKKAKGFFTIGDELPIYLL